MSLRRITSSAMFLALLIAGQYGFKMIPLPWGQYVTGTWVNLCLALTVCLLGWKSGLVLGIISPMVAFILQIAPSPVFLIPLIIAIGNSIYIGAIHLGSQSKNSSLGRWIGMILGSFAKYLFLSTAITYILIPLFTFPEPIIIALVVSFGITQLFTAAIGGTIALLIEPKLQLVRYIREE